MTKAQRALLAGGILLLPFSTPPGDHTIVFSYGLPFLFLFALGSLSLQSLHFFRVPANLAVFTMVAVLSTTWMVATSFLSAMPVPSLGRAAVHVIGLCIFLHFVGLSAAEPHVRSAEFRRWSELLMLSGAIMAVYYSLVFVSAVAERGVIGVLSERWVGGGYSLPWGASNNLAAALLLPLAAGLALMPQSTRPRWHVAAIAIITFGVLLSLSRNAIACSALLFLGFSLVAKRTVPILTAGAVLLAAALAAEWYEVGVLQEVLDIRFGDIDELRGFNNRIDLWRELIPLLPQYLLWPVGFYGSLSTFDQTSPHNAVLTTALEQGLVGLLLGILLFAIVVRRLTVQLPHNDSYGTRLRKILLTGVLVIMLNLQFEDPHFTYPYIIYAWIFLGLIALAARGVQAPTDAPGSRNPRLRYA